MVVLECHISIHQDLRVLSLMGDHRRLSSNRSRLSIRCTHNTDPVIPTSHEAWKKCRFSDRQTAEHGIISPFVCYRRSKYIRKWSEEGMLRPILRTHPFSGIIPTVSSHTELHDSTAQLSLWIGCDYDGYQLQRKKRTNDSTVRRKRTNVVAMDQGWIFMSPAPLSSLFLPPFKPAQQCRNCAYSELFASRMIATSASPLSTSTEQEGSKGSWTAAKRLITFDQLRDLGGFEMKRKKKRENGKSSYPMPRGVTQRRLPAAHTKACESREDASPE
ncbi:hypothetical protein MGYG_03191 [Nannizzia gypsea CBS 118893]|uniref:Uncharacterized protein n=1 Tax=Arthroderma gypseum (strain ATCC MYA-4604 / CBS 118893) TaxID=535722 RepID=E4URC3_ARTGP|nr:hypothetical protein MGYG_03191 [Nannizzia gypsea CBS 118893]EFR00186.1 hypothetical protein MGYG_03191 [Nannizzia gypsea CBS 118893]